MKKISNILAVLFALLLAIFGCITAFADDYDMSDSVSYYIEDYSVDMIVNENNSIDVTENITANFNVQKHGIYRYIPIRNYIQRADGSSATVKTKITNIDVNANFDVYTEGDNCVIQIGDEDKTLVGTQNYTITYTYNVGRDVNEDFDELYYNIIGDGWDTYIKNVSFTIQMPKPFDTDKIGFSAGSYGTEGNNNVTYSVDGNTITGSVESGLDRYQALTTRIELDDGYFTFNQVVYAIKLLAIIIPSVLALLISILLWHKYGRDKKIVDVVEFYPPDNLNSAEIALWYNGISTSKDTIAMMIELANEGYIKISEVEQKKLFSRTTEYKIEKLSSTYTGHDRLKHKFFNGLFKNGKRDFVYISDLENEFYTTAEDIVSELNDKREEVFHSKSLKLRFVGWIASILAGVIAVYVSSNILGGSEKNYICFVAITICIISFIISFFIRQRTDKGHELKQRINGFKIFLETAEKDKLETLVNDNPEYFYNILPYAYVLGVSDKWIKNFEGITLKQPDWYYGPSFTSMTMYHFMHHAMPMAQQVMTAKPNSNGSGGSFGGGGGGFAGGGFGGGGGGSW